MLYLERHFWNCHIFYGFRLGTYLGEVLNQGRTTKYGRHCNTWREKVYRRSRAYVSILVRNNG